MHILVADRPGGSLAARCEEIADPRVKWVHHVADAKAAVEALSSSRYDVVLAADSEELRALSVLTIARMRQPATTRILLTQQLGGRPLSAALVESAHRVLTAMPTPVGLLAMITAMHAPNLPATLADVVGSIAALPSVAELLDALRVVLDDETSDAADVAAVVSRDPSLAAKTLQLANSGFTGVRQRVATLEQAAGLLGRRSIQEVLIASMAFAAAEEMGADKIVVDLARRHGAAAAAATQRLAGAPEWASAGALLIDIGLPLMSLAWPDGHGEVRAAALNDRRQLIDHERRRFGCTHADAGAALARRWSLPEQIVRMVSQHHHPPAAGARREQVMGFLAHYLAQEGAETGRDPFDADAATLEASVPAPGLSALLSPAVGAAA